jgi:pilus assembly protein Flp/PilA
MRALIAKFWTDARGTTAIEYALIAGLISIAIVGGLQAISGDLDGRFTSVADGLAK